MRSLLFKSSHNRRIRIRETLQERGFVIGFLQQPGVPGVSRPPPDTVEVLNVALVLLATSSNKRIAGRVLVYEVRMVGVPWATRRFGTACH